MGRKPSTRRTDAFKNALKVLKNFGFIDYDLRKPLSKHKATRVKKLINQHSHIIQKPTDFVKRSVKKTTKENWQKQGYETSKKYLIIPKQGFETIHVYKDKIVRRNYDKRETIYSHRGIDLYNQLQKIGNRTLRTHEYITVKLGNNAPFARRFVSVNDLLKYVSNWTPKDKGVRAEDLISTMSVVRFFDYEELRDYGELDESDFEE